MYPALCANPSDKFRSQRRAGHARTDDMDVTQAREYRGEGGEEYVRADIFANPSGVDHDGRVGGDAKLCAEIALSRSEE
jgi:hypothetical protein